MAARRMSCAYAAPITVNDDMAKTLLFRRFLAASLLGSATLAGALSVGVMFAPSAYAQFFNDRYPFFDQRNRRGGSGWGEPPVDERPVDYSRAPAPTPRSPDAPAPTSTIMVVGDSTADWLAYGLEDALADTPEIAVVRKHKSFSGLIRYETRSEIEWPQVARELLAATKPNIVVAVLGLQDRQAIREKIPAKQPGKPGENAAEKKPDAADTRTDAEREAENPVIAVPEPAPQASKAGGAYEFRSEKWEEAYGKRVDDMIAALKSSGAAVVWVGLPAIRGTRSTAEASYLNEIYRARAEKAGIFFVDVWDGFVDEQGRFMASGPDVEGQNRRLRAGDGVHYTKAGARKLAHYVERELRRGLLTPGSLPAVAALPNAPEKIESQQTPAKPGIPAVRPLAGPVLFLNTPPRESSELLGGPSRQPNDDSASKRILVKGEAVEVAMGRADDFTWPLRAPNTKVDQPLPPTTAPIASIAPPQQTLPTVRAAVPGAPGQTRIVAGQPVLSGQIQPQAGGPRGQPQTQGFWRSAPVYRRPPSDGFFGLFR